MLGPARAGTTNPGDPRLLAAAQSQPSKSLEVLANALGPGPYQSPFPELSALSAMQDDRLGSGYKLLSGGHIGLLALYLKKNDEKSGSFAEYSEGLTELRQIVSDAKLRHPEAWVGLTGLPVMENDEMESSQTGHGPGRTCSPSSAWACSTWPASAACGIPSWPWSPCWCPWAGPSAISS